MEDPDTGIRQTGRHRLLRQAKDGEGSPKSHRIILQWAGTTTRGSEGDAIAPVDLDRYVVLKGLDLTHVAEVTLETGLHLIGAHALADKGEVLLVLSEERSGIKDYGGLILIPSLDGELVQRQVRVARSERRTKLLLQLAHEVGIGVHRLEHDSAVSLGEAHVHGVGILEADHA